MQVHADPFIDPLTNLGNRRGLRARLPRELAGGVAGSAVLCDIDLLRSFNDRNGYQVGDEVIRRVATMIAAAIPEGSVAYRWGGDEFVVWLPSVDGASAHALAERICASISNVLDDIPLEYPPLQPMTACFVVVGWAQGDAPAFEALMVALTEALPRRRNTVVRIDSASLRRIPPGASDR